MPQFRLIIDLGNSSTTSVSGIRETYAKIRCALMHMLKRTVSGRINFVDLTIYGKLELRDGNGNVVGHYEVVDTSCPDDLPEESKPGCFGAFGLKGKGHEQRDCENGTGCKWQARCKQSREDF